MLVVEHSDALSFINQTTKHSHLCCHKNYLIMRKFFSILVLGVMFSFSQINAQSVIASYYADKFHGRKTASGVLYDRNEMTCAHKTLSFGTVLKVVNPRNNSTVYVKVTDRGPFIKGRSIDLSYAAAKKIGMIGRGVMRVEISEYIPEV